MDLACSRSGRGRDQSDIREGKGIGVAVRKDAGIRGGGGNWGSVLAQGFVPVGGSCHQIQHCHVPVAMGFSSTEWWEWLIIRVALSHALDLTFGILVKKVDPHWNR